MEKYSQLRVFNELKWDFTWEKFQVKGIRFFCKEELHICSKETEKIHATPKSKSWAIDAYFGKVVCAYHTLGAYYDILITPMGPLELSFLILDPDNYNLPNWGKYNYPDGTQREIGVNDLTTPEYRKLWEDAYHNISFGDTMVKLKVRS